MSEKLVLHPFTPEAIEFLQANWPTGAMRAEAWPTLSPAGQAGIVDFVTNNFTEAPYRRGVSMMEYLLRVGELRPELRPAPCDLPDGGIAPRLAAAQEQHSIHRQEEPVAREEKVETTPSGAKVHEVGQTCECELCIQAPGREAQRVSEEAAQRVSEEIERRLTGSKYENPVLAEREATYGSPELNLGCQADLIHQYLQGLTRDATTDFVVTAHEVAIMMVLVKLGRIATGPKFHEDNYRDAIGYLELAMRLAPR